MPSWTRSIAAEERLVSHGSGDLLVTQTRRAAASGDGQSGHLLVTGSRQPLGSLDRDRASEQRL
jgi:hypothetical protein